MEENATCFAADAPKSVGQLEELAQRIRSGKEETFSFEDVATELGLKY